MEKNISQPFDQETEEAVLGALLLEKKAMANAMPILRAEMFYYDITALSLQALTRMFNKPARH